MIEQLLRPFFHFTPPPDPKNHLHHHRAEAQQPKTTSGQRIYYAEPRIVHVKFPRDGIIDMSSASLLTAADMVFGGHHIVASVAEKREEVTKILHRRELAE